MSTDFYDSEQRVFYDPAAPATYYGWYISWSSDSDAFYPFCTPERRAAWIAEVARHFGGKFADYQLREFAVLLACAEWGESDSARTFSHEHAFEHYADGLSGVEWECALDLASSFDPSEDALARGGA